MKVQETCTVRQQEQLCKDIYSLWLESDRITRQARPGQFVTLYSKDRSKLLPRPVSLCEIDAGQGAFRLVYRVTGPGTGTAGFSALKKGDQIQVMGPAGNGFPIEKFSENRVILIGGGIGIPPLLEAGRGLRQRPVFVLGYRDQVFLKNEFEQTGEVHISTEDGSTGTRGTVMDSIQSCKPYGDVIFACGPKPMLRAVARWARENTIPCWVSLEERMACGVGACLGCVCQTVHEDPHFHTTSARVCADGPVFEIKEVEL